MSSKHSIKRLAPILILGALLGHLALCLAYALHSLQSAPHFVRFANAGSEAGVQVFFFHGFSRTRKDPYTVSPARFESYLHYLQQNNYHTLTADELYAHLTGNQPAQARSVMLTFDDGEATLWTVVYPLLKKYNMRGVAFLIPGQIKEGPIRPNLNDVFSGRVSVEMLDTFDAAEARVTWNEVQRMHESGVVDFQSHTLDHSRIYVGDQIRGFFSPDALRRVGEWPVFVSSSNKPVNGRLWGAPLYDFDSRLSGQPRYFDDELLRNACTDYVSRHGGEAFFASSGWEKRLKQVVAGYRRTRTLQESYETPEQQKETILFSLTESKRLLEEKLPGKTIRHLAPPWHIASPLSMECARQAGYLSVFLGSLPGREGNRTGGDPYQIVRWGQTDWIFSLPGSGQKRFIEVAMQKGWRIALSQPTKPYHLGWLRDLLRGMLKPAGIIGGR